MSGQIFISYRREENRRLAKSLCFRLCRDLAPEQVLMDVDSIAVDVDYIKGIEKTVAKCDVLIALIGSNWFASTDERGERRIDNPEDFVRTEIRTALEHGIRVIPVLLDGELMPTPTDLPEEDTRQGMCMPGGNRPHIRRYDKVHLFGSSWIFSGLR